MMNTKLLLILITSILCCQNSLAEQTIKAEPNLSQKWQAIGLSQEQQAWLIKHPVIKQVIVRGTTHLPYEYTDEHDVHQGLTSDYLQIISEKLGIKFQITSYAINSRTSFTELSEGKVDFASHVAKVGHREKQAHFSKAIIKMPIVLLGRENSPIIQDINSLQHERVIVQRNSYGHSLIKKNHPKIKLSFVSSAAEGIQALHNKKADIFIHNVFSSEYFQRKEGITGLKVLGTTPYDFQIRFAASKHMAMLIPIIEKALSNISELEKKLIFDKWINIQIEKKLDVQLIIKSLFIIIIFVTCIIGVFTYTNRQLASKVAKRTQELRDLSRHMEKVREEEKAKLSREIHDELGHSLTALTIGIRRLRARLKDKQNHNKANELLALVKSASSMSKQIMTDLRPSILEDLGLVAAIEWLAREFKSRHKIDCRVTANEPGTSPSGEISIALFRIAQESLTNIAKHAHASRVEIVLTSQENDLLLLVSDNGIGLKDGWDKKEASYGLKGIRERVLGLNGELKVDSQLNEGVKLLVRIPSNVK